MARREGANPVAKRARRSDSAAALKTQHLRHSLGYALAQATVQARKAFAAGMLEPTQLRPIEFSVLMLLLSNDGPAPKALSRALHVPAPNLTPVLDRLQRKGVLRRAPDAVDGRGQCVVLTPRGRRVAADAYRRSLTMEDEIMSGLKARERATLLSLLWRLADRLDDAFADRQDETRLIARKPRSIALVARRNVVEVDELHAGRRRTRRTTSA